MPRTIVATLLFLMVTAPAAAGRATASGMIVHYDFDGELVATGPSTLTVFENARGSVSLTGDYRFSGRRSVEIRDVAGDGDFAELQGTFPALSKGRVFFHFAFMTAEPDEVFNIALAGSGHFVLREHGLAFRLAGEKGVLRHYTDGAAENLIPINPFVWYVADVVYDINRGTYDLTLTEEGGVEPRVSLVRQPSPVNLPGSGVSKFSFIGDPPGVDRSNARLYVDDIAIGSNRSVAATVFAAPGRRLLFVDLWDHYQKQVYRQPQCLPALDAADFGLSSADLQHLARAGQLDLFESRARRQPASVPTPDLGPYLRDALTAMDLWRQGCALPPGSGSPGARDLFEAAAELRPEAKLYAMSAVLALAAEERWDEADALFLSVFADWRSDPRFPAICAVLGIARGDLAEAESWLQTSPESALEHLSDPAIRRLWSGDISRALVLELQLRFPDRWPDLVETALAAAHRYYVLLWQGRFVEARAYADRMVDLLRQMDLATGLWLERRGDAAFRGGDLDDARRSYEQSLAESRDPTALLLKLSDVHFKRGDLDLERVYRERIYGTLESKEDVVIPTGAPGLDASRDPCACPEDAPES